MSELEFLITEDGSHTLFNKALNEHYHSTHGAIQESKHIFIKMGLEEIASLDKQKWEEINAIWLDWKYKIGGEKYLESIYLLEVKR